MLRPLLFIGAIAWGAAALAAPQVPEKVKSAHASASAAATKGEKAVGKGAKKTGDAIESGAKKVGDAVSRGAKKLGLPTAGASAPGAADQVAK